MLLTRIEAFAEIEKGNAVEFLCALNTDWKLFIPNRKPCWGLFSSSNCEFKLCKDPCKKAFISKISQEHKMFMSKVSDQDIHMFFEYFKAGYKANKGN